MGERRRRGKKGVETGKKKEEGEEEGEQREEGDEEDHLLGLEGQLS